MEKKHCQTYTDNGVCECGNLIGNICKADDNHPFVVTTEFHNKICVVGCMSWSKYFRGNYEGNDKM